MKSKQKANKESMFFLKGTSIIEALVLIFVFSVAVLSFYSVFAVGAKYILNSKNKILAISLANQEMEKLRNLPYDQVALKYGVPAGPIDQYKDVTVGDKTFRVETYIQFDDDPEDGTYNGIPLDNVSNDYKIVKVWVLWGERTEKEKVALTSRFVPPGVETNAGGGTFSINSIDYAGNPVSNVSVNIFNNQLTDLVNYSTFTGTSGNVLLQGVVGDPDRNYRITMNKSGYETVMTYPADYAAFIPNDMHSNIIVGALNEKTIIINKLSNLTFNFKDSLGNDLANVDFDLTGGRRLDDGSVEPGVYKYDQSVSTNSEGNFSVSNVSSGRYFLEDFSFSSGDYEFRKIEAGDDLDKSSLILVPGSNLATDVLFMDRDVDSAYIKVSDSISSAPVSGAEVKLKNELLAYEVTLTTDKYGYVYFPQSIDIPLQNSATYEISVSKDNYQDENTDITINKLTNKEVILEAD